MSYGEKYSSNLTLDEKNAIHSYTGIAYANINATLRGIESKFDIGNYECAKTLHSILQKTKLPCDCVVYRGVSSKALGKLRLLPDNLLMGKVFFDKGFMSTTLDASSVFNGDLILEINAPAGANAMYVGYVSSAGHYEAEVLFDINQNMRIDKVRRDEIGTKVITVTII